MWMALTSSQLEMSLVAALLATLLVTSFSVSVTGLVVAKLFGPSLEALLMAWRCFGRKAFVRSLIDRHWDAEVVHVFQEANQAAHFMAKLSHSLAEGFHVFDSPHVGLISILAADLNGPLVPRLCVS
ncbi:ribonuclease H [Senna tora]|uniref:Ribonuclease H n=1 Tax=Senna tora TaxID=362788 RepID=A0A834T5E8_9FABA|nr:ribonuclease H [Senna tora]